MMSAAAARMDRGIGKKELAGELGWTRPKLDRRLESDPKFPVLSRGDQSGGWAFSLAAVKKYLGVDAPAPAIDRAQLRDVVAPPLPQSRRQEIVSTPRRSADHRGEATAKQRREEAQAQVLENKLRVANGELVVAGDLRQVLTLAFASLAHDLDALPEKIVKACDLPEDAAPGIRGFVDTIRTEMVKRVEPLLKPDA